MFLKTSLVLCCKFCVIFQNQATKFGQLVEREKYLSSKIKLKMSSGDKFRTSFFTKDKSKWLKLQASKPENRSKRDSSTGIFLWIWYIFFQKPYLQNTFGWLFLLIPPFQPRFYNTFMITLFSSFPSCFSSQLVRGSQTHSPFLRNPPLDPACPPFWNICLPSPLFCFTPF